MGNRQRARLLRRRKAEQSQHRTRIRTVAVTGTLVAGVTASMVAQPMATAARPESVTATRLPEIVAGPGAAYIEDMTAVGNSLYFTGSRPTGSEGRQLWKAGTTGAATQVTKRLSSGFSNVKELTLVGSHLYFTARDTQQQPQIYKKATGSDAITQVSHFTSDDYDSVENLTAVGGTLFFSHDDSATGRELWKTSGEEPTLVKDITPGSDSSRVRELAPFGNKVAAVIESYDSYSYNTTTDVWVSDGTESGTLRITDTGSSGYYNRPSELTAAGNTLYFSHSTSQTGRELWKSNGTQAGTAMVADIAAGYEDANPRGLTALGNEVAFTANDSSSTQIWLSNGTSGGTRPLTSVTDSPSIVGAVSGTLYFAAGTSYTSPATQLWTTSAAPGTAKRITAFASDVEGVSTESFAVAGGRVYFSARDGVHGAELWTAQGNRATMVVDGRPGGYSSSPYDLTAVGGTVFFTAEQRSIGRELWKTSIRPADNAIVGPILKAATTQKQRKTVKVTATVAAGEAFTAAVSGKVKIGRKTIALKGASVKGAAGRATTATLTLSGAQAKAVTKAVAKWRKAKKSKKAKLQVTATLTGVLTDGAANRATRTVVVKLS